LLAFPAVRLRFDRGTIVAVDPHLGLDLAEAAGFQWDARVQAYRAPAFFYPAIKTRLVRHDIPFSDQVRPSGQQPNVWSSIELRRYQEAAIHAWELSGRRGIVALPTGSGKTRIAVAAMARTKLTTLCLVPTRVLLHQWLQAIRAAYPHAIGCLGDGERELAPITVATFEAAYRNIERIGNRFDLLIVDEVHHFGTGLRDETLEMAIADARLGLSATPPRARTAVTRLAELIGPLVYELAIADLTGGFLASFDIIALHLDLTEGERATYESLMETFRAIHKQFRRLAPTASWQEFVRFAAPTPEGRGALSAWRQARKLLALTEAKRATLRSLLQRHRHTRTLVFTADNEAAYAIAREHLIMPITCDVGRKERDVVLERFRSGALRALVSARVLNEGLDVPDADLAIIVGSSLGEREHVQRVGRLLRPAPGKRALVYELVARRTTEVGQARRRRAALGP
jgi:superfamily II DNA or RNA helicase